MDEELVVVDVLDGSELVVEVDGGVTGVLLLVVDIGGFGEIGGVVVDELATGGGDTVLNNDDRDTESVLDGSLSLVKESGIDAVLFACRLTMVVTSRRSRPSQSTAAAAAIGPR